MDLGYSLDEEQKIPDNICGLLPQEVGERGNI